MKTSEKILLVATVLCFLLFIGWRMGMREAVVDTVKSLGTKDTEIEALREQAIEMERVLARRDEVEAAYAEKVSRSLAPAQSEDSEKKPAMLFSEEIDRRCKSLGIRARLSPPERQPLEESSDYDLITVNVLYEKDWEDVAKTLQYFDEQFLLIHELQLNAQRDSNDVKVDIDLARVVPLTEEEKEARRQEEALERLRKSGARTNRGL